MKRIGSFIAGLLVGTMLFGGSVAYAAGVVAELSSHRFFVDGQEVKMTAYAINGNNYVMLRDIGKAVGFNVHWDSTNGCVQIESDKPYTGTAPAKTQSVAVGAKKADYCVNPNIKGVPQTVAPGESIKYLANEIGSDPKVIGIIANGYPHRRLSELKLENKYQAYYATKMALWAYLLPNWDINNMKVNPNLTGVELERANKMLAAVKDIYRRGTVWSTVLSPNVTVEADQETAYPATINGQEYLQQIFTVTSETWVCNYAVNVAFSDPSAVPAGTKIVDMDNKEIDVITTKATGKGYAGQFKVLYPASAVDGQSGSVQLSFRTNVYKYAIYYAVCAEKDKYGNLQNYMCDTDPTTPLALTAYSNYTDTPEEEPTETSMKILKYEEGTTIPLKGAMFEVVDPKGASVGTFATNSKGQIVIPLTLAGNYTVYEREAPNGYLLSEEPAQNVKVEYGKQATVTFENAPYGNLMVKKYSDSGMQLPGAAIRIEHIASGAVYTGETNYAGTAVFTEIKPGAYRIQEIAAPAGYIKSDEVYTATVISGDTVEIPIVNEEKPGLRVIKYHVELFPGQNSELVVSNDRMPNLEILKTDAITGKPVAGVTFTVKRVDSSTLTTVTSDENGRCYLEKLMPGVYEIWEQSVPDGYLLNEAHQMITLFPNRTGTVQFQNYPKPTLTVNKIDSITGDPIKGAKFNVTFRSDKTSTGEIRDLGTYYSDENGQFFIDKLDDGWYTITELEPAAGYSIKDPTSQQVYVEAGRGKVVTFENTPLSAIIVKKVDSSTGDPLQGAWFRVRFLGGTSGTGGTVIAERQTSSNGTFILTGLKAGTYVIEEISAPDGYVLSENDIQTVYLSGNEQDVITVTFGNEAKGSVLIKKIDAITREPLSDVEFMVTESNGTVVGNRNGKYVTDSVGTILIDGLDPNTTLVIKEVRAKSGYVLDDTPQTVKVRSHEVVTVEFRNQPLGGLRIVKLDSVTRKPLAGVEFRVAYADGSYVPDEGGKLSSNGIYRTDENGEILISGIVGTLVVTETKTISGYVIDEETRSQTVVIDPDDLQTLTFYNRPAGGLQIIKSDEDTGARIKGVKFEVRKINGEILGTYTTDRNGVISIPNAENGWYTITELKAAEGYELDATPVNVCVKDGETTAVEITNQRMASIMIHKVDAATGEGIYGVKFVLYDAGKNPIGEYATDQDGYIYIDDELTPGKYYIRELEAAEGYIRDEQYKTVYVEAGKCAQIEWENSAVTGQIQVRKYSADDNLVTGQRAGSALEGAVFEITQARSGKVVGYIVTDARGVAASDPLPLGRYFVTEVSAPKYYQLSSEKMEAEIEYPNQIIKLSAYNKSANLGVTIKKSGNYEVQSGQTMSYDFSGIANTSNVALNHFFWHDRIPTDATRALSISTGTYNARLYYKVTFKTNLNDYRTLASNLLTSNNYSLSLNAATLRLAQGEYVTDVRFEFGTVPSGFSSVVKPTMRVQVLGTVSNGYQIINRADVGGQYLNEWQTAKTTWVTTVRRFNTTPLPKTGY